MRGRDILISEFKTNLATIYRMSSRAVRATQKNLGLEKPNQTNKQQRKVPLFLLELYDKGKGRVLLMAYVRLPVFSLQK